MSVPRRIKVLIVDDSALVRQVLAQLLDGFSDIEVMATAPDPIFAMAKMNKEWPDVITLDVEMPRMDGITFLKQIMSTRPTPVLICSSLTEKGAATTMQAMQAGAAGIFTKPQLGVKEFLTSNKQQFADAIREAAKTNTKNLIPRALLPPAPVMIPQEAEPAAMAKTTERVIAIGTSTGGTIALEYLLSQLTTVCEGIVIVQHMPEKFTAAFAARLNSICSIEVREARHGDRVRPGLALIAPGGQHLSIGRNGAYYQALVKPGPAVNRHCPSVDVLFRSVAKVAGVNAIGIIMTGMGDDGARGLLEMREAGARTFAQDEDSCVVFGMPKEAIKRNAVDYIVGLDRIPGIMMKYSQ
ncbi:chemotaxis response regulator protein-glutamate methylesterase [Rheinheimera riviphila]|uniref:Protein-glutamate methylesterase/protein-glutamine glutaminase n=1 Tax=Rheinheimera riviphila TaxID=1834037 RepID=A0A437QSN9_9GAMM|nr:chemotaxis response regulator protein-glutamate methylesterase [Rheinheimera riviphila]RVU37538.1 chemotaxis response regulator protein-glutamate methylesterase [Rheinheimera riviphila]